MFGDRTRMTPGNALDACNRTLTARYCQRTAYDGNAARARRAAFNLLRRLGVHGAFDRRDIDLRPAGDEGL
jgi:hypothetical protein